MARAHYRCIVRDSAGNSQSGAMVYVYDVGTVTAITDTIYSGYTGGGTLSNPLTSDANGIVEFFLQKERNVKLAGPAINTIEVATVLIPQSERFGWYNVKDYGAVGDATTDDTTAVQNALNAANTAGGGSVYIPPDCECYVTAALTMYAYTRLYGGGPSSKIICKHATNDVLVFNSGANYLTVEGLEFLISGSINKTAGCTVKMQANKYVYFRHITWDGETQDGVSRDRHFRAISMTGQCNFFTCESFHITCISDNTGAAAVYMGLATGGWGVYFAHGSIQSSYKRDGGSFTTATRGYQGVYIAAGDGTRFVAVEIIGFLNNNVRIDPDSGLAYFWVTHIRFIGCAIEEVGTASVASMLIRVQYSGAVVAHIFMDSTTIYGGGLAATTRGLHVYATVTTGWATAIQNVRLTNCNVTEGVRLERDGTSTDVTALSIINIGHCRLQAAAGEVIYLSSRADKITIAESTFIGGAGITAFYVATGTDALNYTFSDNDLNGAIAGTLISDNNTGTGTKSRTGNNPKSANMLITNRAYYPADAIRDGMDANVTKALLGATEAYQMPVLAFADGGDGYATLSHRVNADFVSSMKARLEWGANANTGNVHWALHYKFVADAASMVDASGTADLGGVAVPATVNYLKETQSGILSTGALASRLLRLAVRRYHDASDTLVGVAHLAGVELEWQEYAD